MISQKLNRAISKFYEAIGKKQKQKLQKKLISSITKSGLGYETKQSCKMNDSMSFGQNIEKSFKQKLFFQKDQDLNFIANRSKIILIDFEKIHLKIGIYCKRYFIKYRGSLFSQQNAQSRAQGTRGESSDPLISKKITLEYNLNNLKDKNTDKCKSQLPANIFCWLLQNSLLAVQTQQQNCQKQLQQVQATIFSLIFNNGVLLQFQVNLKAKQSGIFFWHIYKQKQAKIVRKSHGTAKPRIYFLFTSYQRRDQNGSQFKRKQSRACFISRMAEIKLRLFAY